MLQLHHYTDEQDKTGYHVFKYIRFILLIVAIHISISLCFSYASKYYLKGILGQNTFPWNSTAEEFFAVVLFAPFVETWLLQVLTFNSFSYVANFTNLGKTPKTISLYCFPACYSQVYIPTIGYIQQMLFSAAFY
ncbi:hypothetical protein SAMN05421821_11040 [Mucilaginibacter lappiensis]|uniref:CAAX protease self-immunity n=1 Tax=Mucilaginibacter lappiensis TaxID=354630 RepID=A0ABR6PMM0_9SPHI|nr:hypothetical protein [Mucilaginibacter lappiensis]MBB6111022.1 hypothetical protein [Mucilaginibacter lappiensis]SIR67435.1 hypothetical protein SAMN05421821_11040 [Mucilaginibacter lappiensis]